MQERDQKMLETISGPNMFLEAIMAIRGPHDQVCSKRPQEDPITRCIQIRPAMPDCMLLEAPMSICLEAIRGPHHQVYSNTPARNA